MNILTFDIEDWFHILDNESTKSSHQWEGFESRIEKNVDQILDFLVANDQKATFFCLGWVGEKYPQLIKKIDSYGFEIGSHSHLHQLVFEQNRELFRQDLTTSIKTLEDLIGKKVKSFRAPGFSIKSETLWAIEELAKNGIEYDSSIFPAKRAHGGISDFVSNKPHVIDFQGLTIKEFPINTKKFFGKGVVFSGGGYFRLVPYGLLNRWTKTSSYVMTYFHPRDFDVEQPRIDGLSYYRRFKSYYGIKSAFNKFVDYVKDFEFLDIAEASERIEWSNVERIKV